MCPPEAKYPNAPGETVPVEGGRSRESLDSGAPEVAEDEICEEVQNLCVDESVKNNAELEKCDELPKSVNCLDFFLKRLIILITLDCYVVGVHVER